MITIQEYLRTGFRPDLEYIDGELLARPAGGFRHGETLAVLGAWFGKYSLDWSIKVAAGVRTRTSATRVLLPDLVVVSREERATGELETPPLIAVDVVSPTDTYADLKARAEDLTHMGVRNVWLIDPDRRTGEVWTGQNWQPVTGSTLQAVDSTMFVDLGWLWAELDS